MTTQGSPRTIYRRAIAAGDAQTARLVAGELGTLSVGEALALVLVILDTDPADYPRHAARWHAFAIHTAAESSLAESGVLLASLHALSDADSDTAAAGDAAIRRWATRRRVPDVADELAAWRARRHTTHTSPS